MKRREAFRTLEEIEEELRELIEWRAHHKTYLDRHEAKTSVIEVTRGNVRDKFVYGDPEYEFYRLILMADKQGIMWLADKNIRRVQKEHKKVSKILARNRKETV
jgi:hypothetical protein